MWGVHLDGGIGGIIALYVAALLFAVVCVVLCGAFWASVALLRLVSSLISRLFLSQEQPGPGAPEARPAVRKSRVAAIIMVVIGIEAAIVKFSGDASPEHPNPLVIVPQGASELPPCPPLNPTSLCGSPDASPPATLDLSQWPRYCCRLGEPPDCLERREYAPERPGRGCPGDELCCPPEK